MHPSGLWLFPALAIIGIAIAIAVEHRRTAQRNARIGKSKIARQRYRMVAARKTQQSAPAKAAGAEVSASSAAADAPSRAEELLRKMETPVKVDTPNAPSDSWMPGRKRAAIPEPSPVGISSWLLLAAGGLTTLLFVLFGPPLTVQTTITTYGIPGQFSAESLWGVVVGITLCVLGLGMFLVMRSRRS